MIKIADKWDLIVIGGGPAGCVAAKTAAEKGVRTLLLERKREFGVPVRCGEAVADIEELTDFIELDRKWIDNSGNIGRIIAPNGLVLPTIFEHNWGVLNRKVFDYQLSLQAAEAGAVLRNRCNVTGLQRENGEVSIKYESSGKCFQIKAPIVIGADGVESRVSRWAGLNINLPLSEVTACFQYTLSHRNIDSIDHLDAYFGSKTAPGGYAWIFPKCQGLANVGIAVSGDNTVDRSAKDYLDEFVETHFPGASYLSSTAGCFPSRMLPKRIVADGVMLAGDAAYQTAPLTGGGIIWGMWGGKLAGETAVKAIEKDDFSAKSLTAYTKAWSAKIGRWHKKEYKVKQIARKLSDEILNKTASIINDIPLEGRTRGRIFQEVLLKGPGLMMKAVKAALF
ncbi:NAD(P)/FAD-dependent oxidoreductase [bacterium]|nr:NAD(P)/FAD-dependent oxidoreductase [FCB group bacterium]MBL7190509.1 NAD(P)/FAD-dependent oxidoreductase [bacterium]